MAQQSRDDAGRNGAVKTSIRRMTSLVQGSGRSKFNAASPNSIFQQGQAQNPTQRGAKLVRRHPKPTSVKPTPRRIGKETLVFYRKSSLDIVEDLGKPVENFEAGSTDDLKLPGMKRALYVRKVDPAAEEVVDDNSSLLLGTSEMSSSLEQGQANEQQQKISSILSGKSGKSSRIAGIFGGKSAAGAFASRETTSSVASLIKGREYRTS